MTNPIAGQSLNTTPHTTARSESAINLKVANAAVSPQLFVGFSPSEREAAEQVLAAYRTAIGRSDQA